MLFKTICNCVIFHKKIIVKTVMEKFSNKDRHAHPNVTHARCMLHFMFFEEHTYTFHFIKISILQLIKIKLIATNF